MKQAQLNTADVARRARAMSDSALRFSRQDANEAADATETLERAGCRVSKTGGFYRDEATVYAAELKRRGLDS